MATKNTKNKPTAQEAVNEAATQVAEANAANEEVNVAAPSQSVEETQERLNTLEAALKAAEQEITALRSQDSPKRGRPGLDPAVKEAREAAKRESRERLQRERAEIKARKDAEKAAQPKKKRGRPADWTVEDLLEKAKPLAEVFTAYTIDGKATSTISEILASTAITLNEWTNMKRLAKESEAFDFLLNAAKPFLGRKGRPRDEVKAAAKAEANMLAKAAREESRVAKRLEKLAEQHTARLEKIAAQKAASEAKAAVVKAALEAKILSRAVAAGEGVGATYDSTERATNIDGFMGNTSAPSPVDAAVTQA